MTCKRKPVATPAPELVALSDREREVRTLVARGMSNARLAGALFCPGDREDPPDPHPPSSGLHDRVQAVMLAHETGLVRPGEGAD